MPEEKGVNDAPTENPLSDREMDVATLLATGASNAEIARELVISPHTVKVHLRNIFEKLQVNSRTEASMLLLQRGWIVVPGVEVPVGEPAVPPLPEPEALSSTREPIMRWQRAYLVVAFLVCLLLFLLPSIVSVAQTPVNLLTDAGQRSAPPSIIRSEPRWETRTPLRNPLSRLAMVALDNRLYVLGGENPAGEVVNNVDVYHLESNAWTAVAPLPLPLANLAATTAGNKLYVAGGSSRPDEPGGNPVVTATFLEYDVERDQWSELPALPTPLAGAALVHDGQSLFLIGGWDGQEMRSDIWKLDIVPTIGTDWQLAGQLAKARAFLGATVVGGEIYVVGGYDGQRELDLAEVYSPATGSIRQLPPLSTARGGLALVYDGLGIYALGGGWTQPVSNNERYDPGTNVWSNFPSPVMGEWRNLGAAAVEGNLHLAGGWSGTYLDQHLQYQSSFRALLPVITTE